MKEIRQFINKTVRELLNEQNEETLSLHDRLAIQRAEEQVEELSFNVLPKQKEAVKKFILKGYFNFEESNGTIFCIGGPRYDLNKIIINPDGTYIVTKK